MSLQDDLWSIARAAKLEGYAATYGVTSCRHSVKGVTHRFLAGGRFRDAKRRTQRTWTSLCGVLTGVTIPDGPDPGPVTCIGCSAAGG